MKLAYLAVPLAVLAFTPAAHAKTAPSKSCPGYTETVFENDIPVKNPIKNITARGVSCTRAKVLINGCEGGKLPKGWHQRSLKGGLREELYYKTVFAVRYTGTTGLTICDDDNI